MGLEAERQIKSLKQCIGTLVRCAGGDGNLLFNVGPMPTGEIEPRQVERLKEMGAWLKKYGRPSTARAAGRSSWAPRAEAHTRATRSTCTCSNGRIEGALKLPAITAKIIGSRSITGGKVR